MNNRDWLSIKVSYRVFNDHLGGKGDEGFKGNLGLTLAK